MKKLWSRDEIQMSSTTTNFVSLSSKWKRQVQKFSDPILCFIKGRLQADKENGKRGEKLNLIWLHSQSMMLMNTNECFSIKALELDNKNAIKLKVLMKEGEYLLFFYDLYAKSTRLEHNI